MYVIPSGSKLEPCPKCGGMVYRGRGLNEGFPRHMYDVPAAHDNLSRFPEPRHPTKLRHGWGVKHVHQAPE